MTQVAQIFEEEKQQALKKAREEKQQALKKAREEKQQIVIRMIKKNYSTEEIVSLVSSYSHDDVERLRKEVSTDSI